MSSDLPERRIPVITLMSRVPSSAQSRYRHVLRSTQAIIRSFRFETRILLKFRNREGNISVTSTTLPCLSSLSMVCSISLAIYTTLPSFRWEALFHLLLLWSNLGMQFLNFSIPTQ
mgnify:CR=1 FL=1